AEPTRRRVRRNAFDAQQQRVADAFVSARLLTSDAERGDSTVTVAHEALFRVWAPLKDAVHEEEDTLRLRNDLEQRAMDWDRSGRPEEDLLRGERLRTARGWASGEQRLAGELPVLADFVEASVQADTAALGALSETTAARALANVDRDPDLSLLLAIAAVEDCIPTPAARRTLLTLLAHPGLRVLRGHQDAVQGVSWSPDRGRIATASDDRTVRIWDAELGSELLTLRGHRDAVWAVAWSPDGARIATASRDRTGRIWDSRHGTELVVLNG